MESASVPASTPLPGWSILGVLLAGLGYVASMTPSLLPRPLATQILASVLVAMTMYAIGAIIRGTVGAIRTGALRRADLPRRPRLRLGVSIGALAVTAATTFQGSAWQQE